MKNALVLASASLLVTLFSLAPAADEPPPDSPALSPKVIAFLKPVTAAKGDSELTQKLKERHNSAVALLDERAKEYRGGIRDFSSVFDAARLALEAKLDLAGN